MSSSVRDTLTRVASFSAVTPISKASANSAFSFKVGISEQRLALPQRSPRPFSVPWICRALARTGHLISRLLRHEADQVGFCHKQPGHAGIVGDRAPRPTCHAERSEARMRKLRLGAEELGVGRIGAGIAALDIVDAEFIEHLGN